VQITLELLRTRSDANSAQARIFPVLRSKDSWRRVAGDIVYPTIKRPPNR